MGSVCCSLCHDYEDYVNPNSSIYRNGIGLHFFLQNILYTHTPILQRGEEHSRLASPSSIQGMTSFGSSVSMNNSLYEMNHSPPRPFPYDTDPRYSRLQQDELVSRSEKESSHSQKEHETLRSDSEADADPMYANKKRNNSSFEIETKDSQTKSSFKISTLKETTGSENCYPSCEEEDECPTCLEEYTLENPKIITKCSHHFHLGCIYEWMERSETCPVCGKVMTFDEIM